MRARLWMIRLACLPWLAGLGLPAEADPSVAPAGERVFHARGLVLGIPPGAGEVIIRHEAVAGYMGAMTMPFHVRDPAELANLRRGSEVEFELHVDGDASWVNHLRQTGLTRLPAAPEAAGPAAPAAVAPEAALLSYSFTNELGRRVTLNDFPGQALAITFFYTRCPLPDYCPRLSRNFATASRELSARTNGPVNWHFLSISFDPEFDTPQMLQGYGRLYGYDPAHWSFLTGPVDKIRELARACGMTLRDADGTINHNFRTLIIDASGHLQTVFPFGGDLSQEIETEIIKAAAVTNAARQNRAGP